MVEIRELHYDFIDLLRLLDQYHHPAARLIAMARFLDSVPAELPGRAYYTDELIPRLLEAFSAADCRLVDPEIRESVKHSLETLAGEDTSSAALTQALRVLQAPPAPLSELQGEPTPDRATVLLAAALRLPAFHAQRSDIRSWGVLVPVTVVPIRGERGRRPDRWAQHTAAVGSGALASFEDVSSIAIAGARAAVSAWAQDALESSGGIPAALDFESLAFDIVLSRPGLVVSGESAGLGLAAAFAGAYAGLARGSTGLRPAPRIAWTGTILPTGGIGPVSRESLRAKVRAAYFENLDGAVVPESQLEEARAALPRESRAFLLSAQSNLAATMLDPRLFVPWRIRPEVRNRGLFDRGRQHRIRSRRGLALSAGVLFLLVLASLVFRRVWSDGSHGGAGQTPFLASPARIQVSQDGQIFVLDAAGNSKARMLIPEPYPAAPSGTTLITPRRSSKEPWVLAWTQEETGGAPVKLFAWDALGRPLFDLSTTADTPYPYFLQNAKKFVANVEPVNLTGGDMTDIALTEVCHYYTSTIRIFSFPGSTPAQPSPREVFRLYHQGHISGFRVSQSPTPSVPWLWLQGSVNIGQVREAMGGSGMGIYFLAIVPFRTPRVEVFPPWTKPSPEFVAAHPEGFDLARDVIYFAIRTFSLVDDRIDWSTPQPLLMDRLDCVRQGDTYHAELLTHRPHVSLDLDSDGNQVQTRWNLFSYSRRALELRAARENTDPRELVSHFLADSVVYLVWAPESLRVEGNFTDIRARMPRASD